MANDEAPAKAFQPRVCGRAHRWACVVVCCVCVDFVSVDRPGRDGRRRKGNKAWDPSTGVATPKRCCLHADTPERCFYYRGINPGHNFIEKRHEVRSKHTSSIARSALASGGTLPPIPESWANSFVRRSTSDSPAAARSTVPAGNGASGRKGGGCCC